jgi:acyl dehydratase
MRQASEFHVGDSHEQVVIDHLERSDIARYAGAAGTYGRIHLDEPYAQASGLPSVCAHGMHTMGAAGRCVTDYVGDATITRFGGRFTSPVWPGDVLRTRCTVTGFEHDDGQRVVVLDVTTLNQADKVVFEGYAAARLRA